jgi:hypothetical protein
VIAKALFQEDDTIRMWHRVFEQVRIKALGNFGYEGES